MSDFVPHTPGLATCLCPQCALIRCGAIDANWNGWSWVEFAGEARVAMMQLTWQAPVRWVGPKQRWAGCIDWFRCAGHGLDFSKEGDDESA
jgi:hypothetical protein